MTVERSTYKLTGCAPIPLAHYLKALGVLRLVAEQVDPDAQGWWAGDVFHLRTSLDRDGLRDFFIDNYQPTPIVAPWNGGSGEWRELKPQRSFRASGYGVRPWVPSSPGSA